jgi:endogenous inhibitor of DNA gyrase (YacG/DUF329 family)
MDSTPPKRIVKCPQCGGPSEYSSENAFRPFCSERCKLIDLGEWASNGYAIPVVKSPSSDSLSNSEDDYDEEDPENQS